MRPIERIEELMREEAAKIKDPGHVSLGAIRAVAITKYLDEQVQAKEDRDRRQLHDCMNAMYGKMGPKTAAKGPKTAFDDDLGERPWRSVRRAERVLEAIHRKLGLIVHVSHEVSEAKRNQVVLYVRIAWNDGYPVTIHRTGGGTEETHSCRDDFIAALKRLLREPQTLERLRLLKFRQQRWHAEQQG